MPATVALVCVVSIQACGSGGGSPAVSPDVATVSPLPYTTVWSADPGIDLFGRGAELIRATKESVDSAYAAGMEYAYPGYLDAVRDIDSKISPANPRFHTDGRANDGNVYTWFRHIIDYSDSSNSVSATVCSYRLYQEPRKSDSSMVLSDSAQITLANTAELPGKPGIIDTDVEGHDPRAQRTPVWNVFGNWKITGYTSILSNAISQGCIDWWKQEFPTFTLDTQGSRAVLPPPGYVMPTMPLAVQYPEWIGPANET
ncbi:hypothetical protein [Rhodococcus sp. NPDC055024]